MPLLKFHMCRGRTPDEISALLDTAHRVMVETFKVPDADRYQLVTEYEPSHMRIEDTGLGLPRSDKFVLLEVLSRPRGGEAKVAFYRDLSVALDRDCGISPNEFDDFLFGEFRR